MFGNYGTIAGLSARGNYHPVEAAVPNNPFAGLGRRRAWT